MSEAAAAIKAVPVKRAKGLFRRLLKNPVGLVSVIILAIVAILAIIGGWITPNNPNHSDAYQILADPSAQAWLGRDGSGRDVFSRLLLGTQITMGAALVALVVALVIGVVAGLLAGYYKGWLDTGFTWFASMTMAMPGIIVLLAARAVVGPSVWLSMMIFGVLMSPAFFRLVYASVSAVREELYVDAARVAGLSDSRIISRHILGVVRAPIIIQAAMILAIAIAIQSGLEFLGLGDTMRPTWGSILKDGFDVMYRQPMIMLWPALAIGITSIALTLVANVLRDELERTASRGKKRKGSYTIKNAEGAAAIVHEDDARAAARTGETLLEIKGVHIGYDQPDGDVVEVVHGVDLKIKKGEVHGLIGESGSGKTQTSFAVLGLLPASGRVLAGSIVFDGKELIDGSGRGHKSLRGKRIAYIPQEPMSNLDPMFTIGSQLTEPLRKTLGLSREAAKQKALQLLDRVGIPDPERTFNAYPHQVSGGMAQRVLIAGAVSSDPDLLIADEPTTALDVTIQAEVLDLIRDLQEEFHMAVLLVTHNFGVVADLCDRVSVMREGRIVETGPVRAIFAQPEHEYTRSLLDAMLDEEGPTRKPLQRGATS